MICLLYTLTRGKVQESWRDVIKNASLIAQNEGETHNREELLVDRPRHS